MNESASRAVCFAREMTAALGPYDEFIDVRGPGVYARWRNKAGLRCLVCRQPVSPYPSRVKNLFVRHGRGEAADISKAEATSARETYLHYRLKHWVCHELKAAGATDAAVEVSLGDRRPDVFGRIEGRGYAVEIQWSRLDLATATLRTHELRAAGAQEVLWLTRSCNWVEQLPALGITRFNPAGDNYHAHTGFLAHRPRAGLAVTDVSVREVLQRWTAGDLAWAYQDHKKAGWATVTDWARHTKDQAEELARKKRQLAQALAERDEVKQTLQAARTSIQSHAETIGKQAATIIEQGRTVGGQHRTITEQKATTDEARTARDQLDDTVDQLQGELDKARQDLKVNAAENERLQREVHRRKIFIIVLIALCVILVVLWLL